MAAAVEPASAADATQHVSREASGTAQKVVPAAGREAQASGTQAAAREPQSGPEHQPRQEHQGRPQQQGPRNSQQQNNRPQQGGGRQDGPQRDSDFRDREPVPGFAQPETVGGNEGGGNGRRKRRRRNRREGNAPQQPQGGSFIEVDPEELRQRAWKIFLGEVTEEGLALMDDRTAAEASRRAFRVAEIFLQESARRDRAASSYAGGAFAPMDDDTDEAEE